MRTSLNRPPTNVCVKTSKALRGHSHLRRAREAEHQTIINVSWPGLPKSKLSIQKAKVNQSTNKCLSLRSQSVNQSESQPLMNGSSQIEKRPSESVSEIKSIRQSY